MRCDRKEHTCHPKIVAGSAPLPSGMFKSCHSVVVELASLDRLDQSPGAVGLSAAARFGHTSDQEGRQAALVDQQLWPLSP